MISDFINDIFVKELRSFERGFFWGFMFCLLIIVLVCLFVMAQ